MKTRKGLPARVAAAAIVPEVESLDEEIVRRAKGIAARQMRLMERDASTDVLDPSEVKAFEGLVNAYGKAIAIEKAQSPDPSTLTDDELDRMIEEQERRAAKAAAALEQKGGAMLPPEGSNDD